MKIRPVGSELFLWIDRRAGRVKLKRSIHTQLNWAILLAKSYLKEKLSKLRSFDMQ
jgi:hypothetical protein